MITQSRANDSRNGSPLAQWKSKKTPGTLVRKEGLKLSGCSAHYSTAVATTTYPRTDALPLESPISRASIKGDRVLRQTRYTEAKRGAKCLPVAGTESNLQSLSRWYSSPPARGSPLGSKGYPKSGRLIEERRTQRLPSSTHHNAYSNPPPANERSCLVPIQLPSRSK